jgi:hypothetical protein
MHFHYHIGGPVEAVVAGLNSAACWPELAYN